MDLVSAIGLISSFVTLEEAGRSWILIIKDKIKRKEIDINNWDSDDPLVQVCLDRFKTDMGDKYKDHIFSEEEIQDIIRGFFEQNRELRIGNEEKKQMTQIIEDILYAYNEYAKDGNAHNKRQYCKKRPATPAFQIESCIVGFKIVDFVISFSAAFDLNRLARYSNCRGYTRCVPSSWKCSH